MNDLIERIERMSVPEPNTGCWLWLGALGDPGYGKLGVGRRHLSAHRASYEAHVGPIPDGMVVRRTVAANKGWATRRTKAGTQ